MRDGRHPEATQIGELCVLVAEIVGASASSIDHCSAEFKHALDHRVRRAELAIEAHHGFVISHGQNGAVAGFERCDDAILAACEMLERIRNLPSIRGKRLSIRIGIHYGAFSGGDSAKAEPANATINMAKSILRTCHEGEALISDIVSTLLSDAVRYFAKPLAVERPSLAELPGNFYTVARQTDGVIAEAPHAKLVQCLRVSHQDEVVLINEQQPVLLLGRELGNDVVIMDPRASRQHARIERRADGFVLIDHSSNGSFVQEEGAREHCLKNSETLLIGPGRIGCGFSVNHVESDLIFFTIV